jgi:Uma2 family endonuclease
MFDKPLAIPLDHFLTNHHIPRIVYFSMVTIERLITAEELFQMPDLGRCELVRGEIIMMSPAGSEHGRIVWNLTLLLGNFIKSHKLGTMRGAETGFIIKHNPDTVLAPDAAFISADRLPEKNPQGFYDGTPDLAIEVRSPNDRASKVQEKIRDWLDAGCRAVWIVDPETKSVTIYKSTHDIAVLNASDTLTDTQMLPSFSAVVSEIFE